MTANGVIILFGGQDEADDLQAQGMLSLLPDAEIQYTRDTKLIVGMTVLPFIQTVEGARYFGLDSIRKFVRQKVQLLAVEPKNNIPF